MGPRLRPGGVGQTMGGIVIRNIRPDEKILNRKILRSDFLFQTVTPAVVNR